MGHLAPLRKLGEEFKKRLDPYYLQHIEEQKLVQKSKKIHFWKTANQKYKFTLKERINLSQK